MIAGGSTAGGSTAGGSTAGGSTAGGSTAGGSTAGGSTGGGSTGGGSTGGGSTGGGSTGGGSASCAGSLAECSLMCVDLQADVENCGQCGRVCGNGEVCNRGACQVLPTDCTVGAGCGPGYFCDPISRRCMTGCRLSTDCPTGATCSTGQCRCPSGQHACGQQCVSDTAVTSCGASCRSCPSTANGTATCNGSMCGLTCAPGYARNGNTCVEINECLSGNGGCSANATCTNTPGSRTCACNAGFTGDGITCIDINECQTNNGGCDANAACFNTPGSRTCTCNTGYAGTGLTCADVDECLSGNGGCSANATCANTIGSRTCTCTAGYSGNGVVCTDINECLTANGGCDSNATCANTPGARTCSCNAGFSGNGTTCADIDECLTGNGGCSASATCTNTVGSRTCACNAGYTGNGLACTDVNECQTNNGGCNINATCTNTPGSRTCACNAGYSGNGVTCTDVDECATNNGGCSPNATCTNTPGTRTCACNPGYVGDGLTCTVRVGGETCELASLMASGDVLNSTTVGAAINYSGFGVNSICELSNQADVVFTANVPPGQRGRFVLSGATPMDVDLVAGSAASCSLNPRVCIAGGTPSSGAVSFVNGQATSQSIYAIVGGSTPGPFTISYQQSTPVPDDSCATAVSTVSNGQMLTNQSLSGFSYDYECRFTGGNVVGADRVYRATLPALSRLSSTMTPTGFTGRLSVIEGPAAACDSPARRCLSSSTSTTTITGKALNASSTARDFFLVTSNDAAATGTFSLSTTVTPIGADDICSTATTVLASGATLTNQSLTGFETDYTCATAGPDRVYLATVPAMSGLQVTMTPPAGMTARVSVIAAPAATCDSAPVCLAGTSSGGTAGAVQTVIVPNTSAAPLDIFVIAAASTGATTGTFSIAAATVPLPPGDQCESALPLTAGTLSAQTILGFTPTYSISGRQGCRATFGDEDRVYVATVPNGQTLTVSATGVPDLILNLIPSPASSCANPAVACLASSDSATSNGTETVSWLNSTGSPATVFLVVTSFIGNPGAWSMTTTIQ